MSLPSLIGLKSLFTQNYLFYLDDNSDVSGCLFVTGDAVTSPMAKFAIEPASNSTTLVHIRSCYSNKYWHKVSDDKNSWIVATAKKQDEDQKSWSCTLFEPVRSSSDPNKILYFRHAQESKNEYLSVWTTKDSHYACLYTTTAKPGNDSAWTVINQESILILPKHIAFTRGENVFLNAEYFDGEYPCWVLRFNGGEVGISSVGNTLITHKHGSISIKSNRTNCFWGSDTVEESVTPAYESADSDICRFWPVLIDIEKKIIALRIMSTEAFCEDNGHYYSVWAQTRATEKSHLVVTEPVISRLVYNVRYRLSDARIYNEVVKTMDTGFADNQTDKPVLVGVKLSYTEALTTYWNNSIMGKLGITGTISAGIPFVGDASVETSAELSGSYQWGGNVESEDNFETEYQVIVPPNTKVEVSLLVTKGLFDVPFSYVQRDTLFNGKHIITKGNDGVFTGNCCYSLTYESKTV